MPTEPGGFDSRPSRQRVAYARGDLLAMAARKDGQERGAVPSSLRFFIPAAGRGDGLKIHPPVQFRTPGPFFHKISTGKDVDKLTENGITRSLQEITISARMNMQDMIGKAMALGRDFLEAKELLGHGKFLPWLEELGVSSSTANNYMRVAREIAPGSRMASLPYGKALALLAAPAEAREELAEAAEDKSAAEIRKLIAERNRAAEAANAETERANHAEADAKRFYQENGNLQNRIQTLENDLAKTKADLLTAENNRVEVEVVPKDYEQLKKNQADLIEAAALAEERAAAAEAELEAMKSGGEQQDDISQTLRVAMTAFMSECQAMPAYPEHMQRDQLSIERSLIVLESWCAAMRDALGSVIEHNGAVVIE